MGDNPEYPPGFRDGGFDDPPQWVAPQNWTVAASKVTYDVVNVIANQFKQDNLVFIAGNTYTVQFTISNISIFNPLGFIRLTMSFCVPAYTLIANGVIVRDFFCEKTQIATGELRWQGFNQTIGDFMNMDDCSLVSDDGWIQSEAEILLPGTPKSENHTAVATDYWGSLASNDGKSYIAIAYDK